MTVDELRADVLRLSKEIDEEIDVISKLHADHSITVARYQAAARRLYDLTGDRT